MNNFVKHVRNNRHLKFGVPFIGLLVGASFALTNVTSHRYEFRQTQSLKKDEIEHLKQKGVIKREEVSLEELHAEYMQKQYSEKYENLRIPRPWEDETQVDINRKANKKIRSIREIRDSNEK